MRTIEEPIEKVEEPTAEPTVTEIFNVLLPPKRKEDESFSDYKDRQRFSNKFTKAYKKGRLSWDPYILKSMGVTNGLSLTEKNREFLKAVADRMRNKQEGNE